MKISSIVFGLLMINVVCSSSAVIDLFLKTLIRTFETPISFQPEDKQLFSVEVLLANDVFTLDDGLRLFIQQFLLALFNGRTDLFPDDWEHHYPAYAHVIDEINGILDLIGRRTLTQISVKDLRPLIKSLSPVALLDYGRLAKFIEDKVKEEEEEKLNKEDL